MSVLPLTLQFVAVYQKAPLLGLQHDGHLYKDDTDDTFYFSYTDEAGKGQVKRFTDFDKDKLFFSDRPFAETFCLDPDSVSSLGAFVVKV
jgi:hypothetical protein